MRIFRFALVLAAVAAAAFGLAKAERAEAASATVKLTQHPGLGGMLTDGEGKSLYLFLRDSLGTSVCVDACAVNWPPLISSDPPIAGDGVTAARLATLTRADGSKQVTYNGWPLYYWKDDAGAGDVKGQDVGGVWYVVSQFGGPVQKAAIIKSKADAAFGNLLTDAGGRLLYLFKRDERNKTNCVGGCALVWPPVLTTGVPVAADLVNAGTLGTIRRPEGGLQVTYNGWPLYYYDKDVKAGDMIGQEVGGVWYVETADGGPSHTAATLKTQVFDNFGNILVDSSGRALYTYVPDNATGRSTCTGGCARAWPPFNSRDALKLEGAVDTAKLGTFTRADGTKQITYAGWPLYYFNQDVKPADLKGQNFGAVWYVIAADGTVIKTLPNSGAYSATGTVTAAAGGTVATADGNAVTVAAGVVSADTQVRVTSLIPRQGPVSRKGPIPFVPATRALNVQVLDSAGQPVTSESTGVQTTVCIAYTNDDIRASYGGLFSLQLMAYSPSGDNWTWLNSTVNLFTGKVCGVTNRHGVVFLTGSPAPAP
jgi:predicted lipoprotein with Yx(FWY)xxD motif